MRELTYSRVRPRRTIPHGPQTSSPSPQHTTHQNSDSSTPCPSARGEPPRPAPSPYNRLAPYKSQRPAGRRGVHPASQAPHRTRMNNSGLCAANNCHCFSNHSLSFEPAGSADPSLVQLAGCGVTVSCGVTPRSMSIDITGDNGDMGNRHAECKGRNAVMCR